MKPTKHSAIARDLRTPKYAIRIAKPKRGKGSYDRKQTRAGADPGSSVFGAMMFRRGPETAFGVEKMAA